MKRKFLWKSLVIILLLSFVLTACGDAAISEPNTDNEPAEEVNDVEDQTVEEDAEPAMVKIGVLNPTTGGLALFGEQSNLGIQLYFDNNTIDGVEVELVFADTAGDPQQALDQARRLVEQEEVDFLLGLVNSAVAVPLAQYADEAQTPLIMAIAGARAATDGTHSYVVRTSMANGQQDGPLGWYTATELGVTQAATFAWDFLVGVERADAFVATFTDAGGQIVAELKPALGTSDYGPFISQVDPDSIDVIYAFFAGPGAIAFTQQLLEFGYTPGIQVVASGYYTAGVLAVMGEGAEGFVQATQWVSGLDSPANQAFLSYYDATIGGEAGVYVEEGYIAAEVAAQAIAASGGDLSDKDGFMETIKALEFESTSGPFRFDDNGQAVRNVYITKVVVGDDGSVSQEIIATIEDVDINWIP